MSEENTDCTQSVCGQPVPRVFGIDLDHDGSRVPFGTPNAPEYELNVRNPDTEE